MSKKIVMCLALVSLLALGGQAVAEMCTIDDVPAATLLLPYFEVDLNSPNGITTLFSVNNASAAPAIAHVTVWTDLSVPVLDFDVYLTGYDVQTMNMRDIINGLLPQTQTEPGDPAAPNENSPNGPHTNTVLGDPLDPPLPFAPLFPSAFGPCAGTYGPLSSAFVNGHLKPALTGNASSLSNCVAVDYDDNIARGYVTVDTVTTCNLDFPSTPGYFTTVADFRNILWGDYFYVEPGENFAQGETLVHIEACTPGNGYNGYVGNGAGHCPFTGQASPFTFYSRYVTATPGVDEREGLASQFAVRYITGGLFDGGTDYIVWRDSRSTDIVGGSCPAENDFAWYPLNQDLVVAFDEEENSEELCFLESDVSPPTGGQQTCFPIETGRYNVENSIVPGSQSLDPSFDFGWMFLDLDLTTVVESQAWVTAIMSAEGRYSVGFDAVQLDSVCEDDFPPPPPPG
ncbi:MAG TPA: hypothetical protein VNJ70_12700 [Thermoanaerobaculia bacterium]|nr:hypothetical protein [Thermoanaerobaculia bacterium]